MKTLCWNVWGLGNPRILRALCHIVHCNYPNLVFLMETKCHNKLERKVKSIVNYDCCLSVPRVGNSGGLMLLWNNNLDVQVMSYSLGHIDMVIKESDRNWHFTGIYGNPVTHRRSETWVLLKRLHNINNLPWILGGDFNEITMSSEKWGEGGADRRASQMNGFKEANDHCDLMDAGFIGDMFTWYKRLNGDLIWSG